MKSDISPNVLVDISAGYQPPGFIMVICIINGRDLSVPGAHHHWTLGDLDRKARVEQPNHEGDSSYRAKGESLNLECTVCKDKHNYGGGQKERCRTRKTNSSY